MATIKKPVVKAEKPAPKATAKKAPTAKPAVKAKIKTESAVKTAVKSVKEKVKQAVAKVAPPPVATKPPAKRVTRAAKPAAVKSALVEKEAVSKAPWDSVEGEKLQASIPPVEKTFPLVPLWKQGVGEELFSRVFAHTLNVNNQPYEVMTGYLSVNRTIDIIGLSNSQDMLDRGFITNVDIIDKAIKLASLHIQINGKDKFIDCTSIAHEAQEFNDFRTMKLELTVIVNHEGKNYAIAVEGQINREFGSCYVSARSNPDVEVKGYFLDASRGTSMVAQPH